MEPVTTKKKYMFKELESKYEGMVKGVTAKEHLISEVIVALHWEMENYIDACDHARASYLGGLIDKLEAMLKEEK